MSQREFPNDDDPTSHPAFIQLARNQGFLELTWPEHGAGGFRPKSLQTRPTVYLDAPSLNPAMMDEIARSPEGGKVDRLKLQEIPFVVP